MEIKTFIDNFSAKTTDDEKMDFVMSHLTNEYVPYELKADTAKAIVNSSYWHNSENPDGTTHRVLYIDSVAKHMLTQMAIIELYTDIERRRGEGLMLEDFNALNEAGVIDMVTNTMDQRELDEFNMVLQMVVDDTIANEYEPHAFIANQVNRFGNLVGFALAPILSNIDMDKVRTMIEQIGE